MLRTTLTTLLLVPLTVAHMQLHIPSPFNASNNPHRTNDPFDPYLQYPYDCCGPNARWTYPCRGYLDLLSTPDGRPTATWPAGSTQTWSMTGIGNHYGGSCQVGFSVDGGATFRVATSYEGNCPRRDKGDGPEGQGFEFVVPRDVEVGVHVFAWIWYNREQEFNMSCAAVAIAEAVDGEEEGGCFPSGQRPEMLVADDGNGCLTPRTTAEVKFPFPGPDVVRGDGVYPLELPSGQCDGVGGQGYDGSTGEDGHV